MPKKKNKEVLIPVKVFIPQEEEKEPEQEILIHENFYEEVSKDENLDYQELDDLDIEALSESYIDSERNQDTDLTEKDEKRKVSILWICVSVLSVVIFILWGVSLKVNNFFSIDSSSSEGLEEFKQNLDNSYDDFSNLMDVNFDDMTLDNGMPNFEEILNEINENSDTIQQNNTVAPPSNIKGPEDTRTEGGIFEIIE